jgi:hypothetical protein
MSEKIKTDQTPDSRQPVKHQKSVCGYDILQPEVQTPWTYRARRLADEYAWPAAVGLATGVSAGIGIQAYNKNSDMLPYAIGLPILTAALGATLKYIYDVVVDNEGD